MKNNEIAKIGGDNKLWGNSMVWFTVIQEYSEGKELAYFIQNHTNLEEKKICRLFQQIISVAEYLNNMGFAHRDLKSENILLTRTNDIKYIKINLFLFLFLIYQIKYMNYIFQIFNYSSRFWT